MNIHFVFKQISANSPIGGCARVFLVNSQQIGFQVPENIELKN